jgi:DNA-binding MarR family transcriptional regulator
MQASRFDEFTLLIEGIYKAIQKLKNDHAAEFGIKSVHVFWLCQLLNNPEGLTAAELASQRMIDRSLVSREIDFLKEKGYIKIAEKEEGKKRNYNALISLTPAGVAVAEKIVATAMKIQDTADVGIREKDLMPMYATLFKIYNNLSEAADGSRQ